MVGLLKTPYQLSRFGLKVRCGRGLELSMLIESLSFSFSLRLSAGDWQTLALGRRGKGKPRLLAEVG